MSTLPPVGSPATARSQPAFPVYSQTYRNLADNYYWPGGPWKGEWNLDGDRLAELGTIQQLPYYGNLDGDLECIALKCTLASEELAKFQERFSLERTEDPNSDYYQRIDRIWEIVNLAAPYLSTLKLLHTNFTQSAGTKGAFTQYAEESNRLRREYANLLESAESTLENATLPKTLETAQNRYHFPTPPEPHTKNWIGHSPRHFSPSYRTIIKDYLSATEPSLNEFDPYYSDSLPELRAIQSILHYGETARAVALKSEIASEELVKFQGMLIEKAADFCNRGYWERVSDIWQVLNQVAPYLPTLRVLQKNCAKRAQRDPEFAPYVEKLAKIHVEYANLLEAIESPIDQTITKKDAAEVYILK